VGAIVSLASLLAQYVPPDVQEAAKGFSEMQDKAKR